jgi:hypothetical protein
MNENERKEMANTMDSFFKMLGVERGDLVDILVKRGAANLESHGMPRQECPGGQLPAAMGRNVFQNEEKAPGGNQKL